MKNIIDTLLGFQLYILKNHCFARMRVGARNAKFEWTVIGTVPNKTINVFASCMNCITTNPFKHCEQ